VSCVCLLFVCPVFVLVFGVVFAFASFSMNVTVHWTCIGPLPVYFRPLQHRPLHDLINQLSHMQHALKHVERPGGSHTALDGKKCNQLHL